MGPDPALNDLGDLGDLSDLNDLIEVRRVHPFQATKTYLCPGCHQHIPPGLGHVVVVPTDAPDLRRHWHRACWDARAKRRPGRS